VVAIPAFLAKPAVKWGGLALLGLALVVGALWYAGHLRSEGKKEGAAETTVIVQQKTIEVQRKINDAESKGPRTKSDAELRLRAGTF
jgi:hypothetical protein